MMAMQAVSPAVTPLLLPTADVADNDYLILGMSYFCDLYHGLKCLLYAKQHFYIKSDRYLDGYLY
ncbi:hypothetical protein [Xenorhabdus bovienii]|uniref:hypothetical protein n=1 Tax=Xenorhabdus bovienii TaxID=40576 RepID=UPI00301CFF60